jgi:DNA-binding transcriptional regulator YdaS (Cro superfamily)
MDAIDTIRTQRGLLAAVADGLGLARSTVSEWKQIPSYHVLKVSRLTGIPRSALRPDLYPPDDEPAK